MTILGIDPGASGGIAFFSMQRGLLSIFDMPTVEVKRGGKNKREVSAAMLNAIIGARDIDAAFVEKVGAMPGQGVTSMFSFGRSYGLAEGALASSGVAYQRVTPQAWKKAFGFIGEGKDATREAALERFNSPAFKPKGKGQALADAAYIALWGAQNAA